MSLFFRIVWTLREGDDMYQTPYGSALVSLGDGSGAYRPAAKMILHPMAQNYSLMTERWEIHMNGKTLYVQRSWDDDGPITSSEHIPLTTQPEKRGKEVAVIHRWFSGQYIEFRNELLFPCATGADYICIYNHQGVEKDDIWCHAPVAKIKRVSTSKSQKVLEGWLAQPVEDELFMAMLYAAPV